MQDYNNKRSGGWLLENGQNKKIIEIRWGDISHISSKGRRLPVPSSYFYTPLINIFIT